MSERHAMDWKPRRNGAVYCAPACGRRCTYADYTHAKKAAAELVARLGAGWKSYVHENLGWHYRAINTKLGLDVSGAPLRGYMTILCSQWVGHGRTPELSIKAAIREASPVLKKMAAIQVNINSSKYRGSQ